MHTQESAVVVTKAVEIARRWPTPALRLRGGKVAVPVTELGDSAALVTHAVNIAGRQYVVVVA